MSDIIHNTNQYGLGTKSVKELIDKFGSPLYVFDKDAFVENYKHLLNAFRSIYPKYNIAYSYKTNYTPYICKLIKELGGYAEVVSGMEYQVARKIGYPNDRIVFNGPVKSQDMLEQLSNGGVVNVDNLDELELILSYARELKDSNPHKVLEIAFRVNIDIEQGFISRFGIDADNGDLDNAFELARGEENITVVGIHCHIGRSRGLQAWKNRVDKMFTLVDNFFDNPPLFINLGSGMNSVMEPVLAEQFGGHLPTYEKYASVVATVFREKYGRLDYSGQPELLTEPGTTVVSGYLSFLTTVLSIKTVKEKMYATFDGSSGNMGDICHLMQLPITVHDCGSNADRTVECADFVGYTCLEHDVMYKSYSGKLAVGDVVEFRNVGSYSNVFKPPFIYPNCAMVAVTKDSEPQLMKRRETTDDVFATYVF